MKRLPFALASLLPLAASLAWLPSCTAEVLFDDLPANAAPAAAPTCDGTDPANSCDDCNPCTVKANCTPCSSLPEAERNTQPCTADEDLPAFCAGHTGCYQVPLTTPAGQIDDCFPVAGAAELYAGSCRAGVCVANGT